MVAKGTDTSPGQRELQLNRDIICWLLRVIQSILHGFSSSFNLRTFASSLLLGNASHLEAQSVCGCIQQPSEGSRFVVTRLLHIALYYHLTALSSKMLREPLST